MSTLVFVEQGDAGPLTISPRIVRIQTTDSSTDVIVAGWYNNSSIGPNAYQLLSSDLVAICYSYGSSTQGTKLFTVAISASGVVTLSAAY